MNASPYIGRFAPSPTGPLHFGSLMAATASWLQARHHGGQWLLRIEDLDRPREQPGAADAILHCLEAYGLTWDGPVLKQSERTQHYRAALQTLTSQGRIYQCDCSRSRIAAVAVRSADGGFVYPGTCRVRATPPQGPTAARIRVDSGTVTFGDRLQGSYSQDLSLTSGDFVLQRRDGLFAYHLAVVVDDAAQNITQIVRGADLLASTPSQIYLQQLLGVPTPDYAHIAVANNAAGQKLSKQNGAEPVIQGGDSATLAAVLGALCHPPPAESAGTSTRELLQWATTNWDLSRLRNISTFQMP